MDPDPHGPSPAPARGDPEWLPAAVIGHDAPDGAHFDLLLATRTPSGPDDRACSTWRCAADPSSLAPADACAAEAIDDHRAAYLSLAAPRDLSGGRGRVRPVAVGRWRAGDAGTFTVEWDRAGSASRMTLRLTPGGHELRRTDG